jgi:hypothetical protein
LRGLRRTTPEKNYSGPLHPQAMLQAPVDAWNVDSTELWCMCFPVVLPHSTSQSVLLCFVLRSSLNHSSALGPLSRKTKAIWTQHGDVATVHLIVRHRYSGDTLNIGGIELDSARFHHDTRNAQFKTFKFFISRIFCWLQVTKIMQIESINKEILLCLLAATKETEKGDEGPKQG